MTRYEKRNLLRRFAYIDTPSVRIKYGLRNTNYFFSSNIQQKTWDKIQKAVDETVLDEVPHKEKIIEEIEEYMDALHSRTMWLDEEMNKPYSHFTLEDLESIRDCCVYADIN